LRTRLKQLSDVWGPFDSVLYENRDRFNHEIVCTRNHLTHYENDPDCRIFEQRSLSSINIIILSIFQIILLSYNGIPKLDAFRIVRKHNGRALADAVKTVYPS
jgi:hypothetical protein